MKSHLLREFIRESLDSAHIKNFKTQTKYPLKEITITGPSGSQGPISTMPGIHQDVLAYKQRIDKFLRDNDTKIKQAVDYYQTIGPTSLEAAPLIKELYREAAELDLESMAQTATFPAAIAILTYKLSESWDNVLQSLTSYAQPLIKNAVSWVKGLFEESNDNTHQFRYLKSKYEILDETTTHRYSNKIASRNLRYLLNEAPFDADAAARLLILAYDRAGGDMEDISISNIRRTLAAPARMLPAGHPLREAWLTLSSRNPSHAAMRAALSTALGESGDSGSRSDPERSSRPSSDSTDPGASPSAPQSLLSSIGSILTDPKTIIVLISLATAVAADAAMDPRLAKELDALGIEDLKKKTQSMVTKEMKDLANFFGKVDDGSEMQSALNTLAGAMSTDNVTPSQVQAIIDAAGA